MVAKGWMILFGTLGFFGYLIWLPAKFHDARRSKRRDANVKGADPSSQAGLVDHEEA